MGKFVLGTEQVYVERPIFDEFVARLTGAEGMQLGAWNDACTSMGPLISQEHQQKVLSYYQKAVDEGATVVTGGGVPNMQGDLAKGNWVQPTIWTGLPESASIIKEEIFRPLLPYQPFDSEEQVIEWANDTKYGLAAAVWTENTPRAHRVAAQLDAGIVWVNSWFLRDLRTPFGGYEAFWYWA